MVLKAKDWTNDLCSQLNELVASDSVKIKDMIKCISIMLFHLDQSVVTGNSFSEALILSSTNPQYDKRLFLELQVQYMKIASSEHVVYINCSECQNKTTIYVHNL